jgi:hypothetical protein
MLETVTRGGAMPIVVVEKQAAIDAEQRTAPIAWAVYAAGLASGFFAAMLVVDWARGSVMVAMSAAWAPASAALSGVAAGAALVQMLRARGTNPIAPALAFLCGWAGAFLIVFGGRDVDDLRGSAQLRAWFGTGEARLGMGLLLTGVALITMRGGHHDRDRDQKHRAPHVREDHAGGDTGNAPDELRHPTGVA